MRIQLPNVCLKSAVFVATALLGANLSMAQSVNLTAAPSNAVLPDGQSVPMWGYTCNGVSGGPSCGAANTNAAGWSPVVITAVTGSTLTINLTNSLPVPTSLVIVGQLGGGLGTGSTSVPSPAHTPQTTTWPIANSQNTTFVPPSQPKRVQSFATEVPAGTVSPALTWSGLKAGTYLIESGTHPSIQGPMGLYGILVVTTPPSGGTGTAYPGINYNADIPLILSEIDPVQNNAVNTAVNTAGFSETATQVIQHAGALVSVVVTAGGSGYPANSTVSITGGGGSGATATADIEGGVVTAINVVNGGSGYTTNPTITVTPGATGSGASATAVLETAAGYNPCGSAPACYPPAVNYSPLYYMVNGVSLDRNNIANSLFPTTPATSVSGSVLVRLVNAGLRMHVPSIVGSTTGGTVSPAAGFQLIAEDGNLLPGIPRVQSEVFMAAGKTYDVMINAPANGAPALPIFDRQLSLSTNNLRDGGMQAYIGINGGAAPISAGTVAKANPDSYLVVAGNPLSITDPSTGVIANDIGIYGVRVLTGGSYGPSSGTVVLNPDGTFTYTPVGWTSTTTDSFTYAGNGGSTAALTATVTLGSCAQATNGCLGAAPTAGNGSYTSNLASRFSVGAPGVYAFSTDPAGHQLIHATLKGTATGGSVTLHDDGSFTAVPAAVPLGSTSSTTVSFQYTVTNSQNTVSPSASAGTITVTFLGASNLQVKVYDAPVGKVGSSGPPITDYRWIIEEDRTFQIDPTASTNTGSPVASLGTNFHTSYMPVIAAGCIGTLACEAGQTVYDPVSKSHLQAVCDVGDGICRTDAQQQTPVDPAMVHLDPRKHYYISILPGDAGNSFTNGGGAPQPVDPNNPGAGSRQFDITKDCGLYAPTTDPNSPNNWTPGSGACGHGMGGAQVTPAQVASPASNPVNVLLQETPFQTAKISVFVFEDDFPLNGENDASGGVDVLAPNEPGLGGFEIRLWDDAGGTGDATGQMTYDMFNMPLSNSLAGTIDPSTGKDACPITAATDGIVGRIVTCPKYEADGTTLSPLAGQAVIANMMPGRYGVQATPSADRIAKGEEWLQTNTLDGQKAHDSFIKVGGPAYFQEFGPAGFHVTVGFANPKIINGRHDAVCGGTDVNLTATNCTNTITGTVTEMRQSHPPDQRLYSSGSNQALSFTQCYVSLGDPDGEDFLFTKCDSNGSFAFNGNVPDGDWRLTVFDQWNDQIVDGLSTPVRLGNGVTTLNLPNLATQQWHTNFSTTTFFDTNGNGVRDGNEPGLSLVPTNIRFRDGSYSNFNNTDLNGNAGYNEIFPLFNWYVIESDTTRFKQTGVHVVYDTGGLADQSTGAPATSNIAAFLASTKETNPVPTPLRVPGAFYCANADCTDAPTPLATPYGGGTGGSSGRVDPPWVTTEGWQGFIGQYEFLEFGKTPFAPGENGGIHGEVIYASTRPFDDPALLIHTSWTPDVPNVTVNLYHESTAADGSTSLKLVDTTVTSSWDAWAQGFRTDGIPNMNCPGQWSNDPTTGDPFYYTLKNTPFYLDQYNAQYNNPATVPTALPAYSRYKCYDGLHNFNQVQPAPYDGMYKFPSVTTRDPATGAETGTNCTVCVANPTGDGTHMLPAGKYVVEMITPPGYELVKEEDKNILIGDNYIAPVIQEFGGLGDIFILPDQASVLYAYNVNNGQNPTNALGRDTFPSSEGDTGSVEVFWPCVGASRVVPDYISLFPGSAEVAPFAGATRKLCDRKEVTLTDQTSALAKFWVFSSTHVAAHFTGFILDDLSSEFDPFSPQFGEKFAVPNLPVSIKDFAGNEVERVYSDQWGTYNGLNYSTWEVNPPNPTGYAPTMMVACMNDPGSGATPDPYFNPSYSQFCYEIPYMPGQTQYMDTPVVPTAAFAEGYNPPDCNYPDQTPAIAEVDGDGKGPWTSGSTTVGSIAAVELTNNGAGYLTAPAVTITGGGGSGAAATAVLSGSVASATVTNPGSGYAVAPNVTFTPVVAGAGSGAAATAVISGAVSAVTFTNRGSGYTAAPTVTFSAPTLPGGTTATGVAHIGTTAPNVGKVTGVTLTSPGSGYSSAPTVTFSAPTTGTTATATATISGTVVAINITRGGFGYTGAPAVRLSAPPAVTGRVQATATAAFTGSVTSVTLTARGTGYTTAPTVTFAAPPSGGTLATGAAVISAGNTLTITALGDRQVPNPAYSGPQATAAPFNQKFLTRHYGLGPRGTVTIGGINAPIESWADSTIVVTVPSLASSKSPCTMQQRGVSTATTCGQLVITNGNGQQSIDAVTVTVGGKAPTVVAGENATNNAIQSAIDAASPGDLIMVSPGVYNEMVLMWKPVRLQGVGAASVTINANTHPSGKMDPWRRQVNCLFGLATNGSLLASGNAYDPQYTCAPTMQGAVDPLPLEGIVGWDTTLNGNLAELLQEPSLMGAYEGAGITVLGKGETQSIDGSGGGAAGTEGDFPATSRPLTAQDCTSTTFSFPSNFFCNPSRIDGLTITNSSQGGGGIFVHAWNQYLEISNNRIYGNAGTLSGGINVGQGESPDAVLDVAGRELPFLFDEHVNVHNNSVTANSSYGDELFSASPSAAGGVTFCTGADYYNFNYNWVCGNLSTGDGGGLVHEGFIYNGTISHNWILFNQSNNISLPTNGGGIAVLGAAPDGTPPNSPPGTECGSTTDVDCAPGLSDGTGPNLVIDSNVIMGNTAESGSGGGIRLQTINGTEITRLPGNPASWNSVSVTNNIIANNVAGWDGGGMSLQDALNVNIINNTIASNDTTATAGVLFNTIGAPEASTPPPSCGTSTVCTAQQPAGLVVMQNTANLTAGLGATQITCPAGHFTSPGNCKQFSIPLIANDLFYGNRAFNITTPVPGNGLQSQQNVVTLVPQLSQASTGQCVNGAIYWDIGVRGDTGPTNHSSTVTLNPTYSILTDNSGGYTGAGLKTGNPNLASLYCNGSHVPPENGGMGYAVPPGISDATVPNPVFSLTPAATVDEGNNWINMTYGPLSLSNPTLASNSQALPGPGTVNGNYELTSASTNAIGQIPNTATANYNEAPTVDILGTPRKTNNKVDIGAFEFVPPTIAVASVTGGPLNFGNVTVGATSSAQQLILHNTGGATLTGITVGPAVSGVYTRPAGATGGTCGATLAAGATCTINIVFKPTAVGLVSSTLPITGSVTVTGSPVALTGTGIGAVASVTGGPLSFGNVIVGTTSPAQQLTLHNTGGATLTGIGLTFSSTVYSRAGGTCVATLTAGNTCTINIVFKPTAAGLVSSTLTIAGNVAVTGSPVTLTGTGLTPGTVSVTPNPLMITLTGNNTAATGTVTLTNISATTPVTVTGVVVLGSGTGGGGVWGFTVATGQNACTGATLAPGATCTVGVKYSNNGNAAARATPHPGTIRFTDNATGSPQTGPLVGN